MEIVICTMGNIELWKGHSSIEQTTIALRKLLIQGILTPRGYKYVFYLEDDKFLLWRSNWSAY